MNPLILIVLSLTLMSCIHRSPVIFRILPERPSYLLQSPDQQKTPFEKVLSSYTKSGYGWVHLQPGMALRIEKAYYKEGEEESGLSGFLGTEVVRHTVQQNGRIRPVFVGKQLTNRPPDATPARSLIGSAQRNFTHHRFLYAIVFKSKGRASSSVLLGADSQQQLEALTLKLLENPDQACNEHPDSCTAFGQNCTASIEMEININGNRKMIDWGTQLAKVVPNTGEILSLHRQFNRRLSPVEIDPTDLNARRLPLLPGDQIHWQ